MEDTWTLKQQLHDALVDIDTLKMQKNRLEKQLNNEKECYYATVRSYEDAIHKYHSAVIRQLDQDVDKIKHLLKGWYAIPDEGGLEIQLTDIIKTTMTKTILDYEKALR
jgi:DNA anti-recombination protein RmuC|tara:strand:- start:228 stop:554 length:327 start_codon:yes stop_codon:yes gene_type:complete